MSLFVPPAQACIERIRCRCASACSITSQKQRMNLSSSLRIAAASGGGQLCSAISSAQLRSAASATAASPAAASSSEPPDGSRCTAARSCRTASANNRETCQTNYTNAGYASQIATRRQGPCLVADANFRDFPSRRRAGIVGQPAQTTHLEPRRQCLAQRPRRPRCRSAGRGAPARKRRPAGRPEAMRPPATRPPG